jgi:DNA polymerase-4
MGPAFVETLPIGKFHGVGPATAAKMAELGIHTGADLRRQTRQALTARFGRIGEYYYAAARGEDDRPVRPDSPRKSIGTETTFQRDLVRWDDATAALAPLFEKVWAACQRTGLVGRTVTVKVKYADFQQITRSRSSADPIATSAMVERMALDLLRPLFPAPRGIRLLGVTLSHLDEAASAAGQQLALPIGSP